MNVRDNGGPAFPCEDHYNPRGEFHQTGMTLRDWFAGQALTGLIARHDQLGLGDISRRAYRAADEMIAVRKGDAA